MLQNIYDVTLTLKFQSNNSKYLSLFSVNYLTDLTYLTEENYLTERKETRPICGSGNHIMMLVASHDILHLHLSVNFANLGKTVCTSVVSLKPRNKFCICAICD